VFRDASWGAREMRRYFLQKKADLKGSAFRESRRSFIDRVFYSWIDVNAIKPRLCARLIAFETLRWL
jgi:hypothetical protein